MTYDLKSIQMPRIHGAALRALATLVEQPGIGHAIRSQMLGNLGFDAFRKATCDAPIAYGPVLPAGTPEQGGDSVGLSDLTAVAAQKSGATGFSFEGIADFHDAYREGRTTPVKVAERLLEVIAEGDRSEPAMRVFIAHHREDLLAQASKSAERYASGKPLSVLDGVPVPVKDEVDMQGYPTTVGTRFLGSQAAEKDATTVARLRAAGALLPGKTNMHELGIGVTGLNPHHGSARNPYDPKCFTGGSSSGSAAAVGSGMGPLALGADGGGSIRIPASFCGLVGLKPTFGRVSEHGAAPLCWSVAHIGPIAGSARDAAIGYAIMAGHDPHDRNTAGRPRVHLDRFGQAGLEGYRFGIYRPWFEDADPQVVAACESLLQALAKQGAEIREIEIPGLDTMRVAHLVTIVAEMAASQLPHERHRRDYAPDTRMNLALGRALMASDYVHAQRHRTAICARLASLLETVDGIVTPTTGCTSEPLPLDALDTGESNMTLLSRIMRFAGVANLTGLPAITFPAGYDTRGMPIGLHVMGRAWDEHRLLNIAHVAEGLVERKAPRWHRTLLSEQHA
jgi:Asp-tRNA(Asn)/Glu-tRNA(Gln) amidotransferase A subunit family amidase